MQGRARQRRPPPQSDGATFVQRAGSLAILLNSFSLLQVLRPFEGPGVLISVTTEIVYQLRFFMLIITVLLIGFSSAFAVAMPDNLAFDDSAGFDGAVLTSGLLTSYLAMLGTFDIADYTNTESMAFFALFLFLILVIMLNLLIALMSDTFERVMESWVFESRKMRINTIIEQELLMGESRNAEYFPEYLQVLRPVEEVSDEWTGLSGQITATREEVKREVGRVEQKVDAMAAGDTDVLVSHPGLNRYLDLLMGEGNSLQPETGEPCKLLDGEVTALAVPSAADDEAPLVGGSELRDPSRQWVSVESHRFAQGVRVVAAPPQAAARRSRPWGASQSSSGPRGTMRWGFIDSWL